MRMLQTIIVLFLICTGISIASITSSYQIENALTLVTKFGTEFEDSDYLLNRPYGFDIDQKGNVYVLDEHRVKVYDTDGNSVKIIGRPGQGPGEFEGGGSIAISHSGYISVIDQNNTSLSIFSPDHSFQRKFSLDYHPKYESFINETGLNLKYYANFIKTTATDNIIQFNLIDTNLDDPMSQFHLLVHESGDELKLISKNKSYYNIKVGSLNSFLPFNGRLMYGLSESGYIAYANPYDDRSESNGKNSYSINIYSLKNGQYSKIEHSYTPVIVPDSAKASADASDFVPETKSFFNKVLSESKYYPPLHGISVDGNLVFAFRYETNDKKDILTDIYDIETGKYLSSAYFRIPVLDYREAVVIKNGFLYRLGKNSNGFVQIEKYKISEKIYSAPSK